MKKTTREWVKKAEQDFALANHAGHSAVAMHDGVCFHCHLLLAVNFVNARPSLFSQSGIQ